MGKLRVLHFADCHLKDDDQLPEKIECLNYMQKQAVQHRVELIICAGDIFDSQYVRLDSQAAKYAFDLFARLGETAPVVIIAGTPSHEGSATDVFDKIKCYYPIKVATKPEQDVVRSASGNPVLVTSIPAFTKQYLETEEGVEGSDNQAARLMAGMMLGFGQMANDTSIAMPHVLIGHFQVRGAKVSETQILTGVDIEVDVDSLLTAGPDLVCLGHIHKRQEVYPGFFYSGSIHAQNWGELDEKGFYIHTIDSDEDGHSTDSKFIATPSPKRLKIQADMTDGSGYEAIEMAMYQEEQKDLSGAKIRLEIKVFVDEADTIDSDSIKAFYLSAGAKSCDVIRIRVPRINIRSSKLIQITSLRDRIKERARLIGDEVSLSILSRADLLEKHPEDAFHYLEKGDEDGIKYLY